MNYTRQSSPHGSKCIESWDETNYTEYLTDESKDWPYSENVSDKGTIEKDISRLSFLSNAKGSAFSLLSSLTVPASTPSTWTMMVIGRGYCLVIFNTTVSHQNIQ